MYPVGYIWYLFNYVDLEKSAQLISNSGSYASIIWTKIIFIFIIWYAAVKGLRRGNQTWGHQPKQHLRLEIDWLNLGQSWPILVLQYWLNIDTNIRFDRIANIPIFANNIRPSLAWYWGFNHYLYRTNTQPMILLNIGILAILWNLILVPMFNQYCRTKLGKIGPSDFQYRETGKEYESKNGPISNIYLNSNPILDQFLPNVIAMINKASQYEPIIGPIFVLLSK